VQHVTRNDEESYTLDITVNKLFTVAGDGLWSNTAKQVFVTNITMYIGALEEDGYYGDGDLAVHTTAETWNEQELGLIYTDKAFIADVRAELIAAGIDAEVAADVDYSEQGMQDTGRVSCDAYKLADYVRAQMQKETA
jgi:hypothetical protein